jgi:hypothetical protein
MKDFAAPTSENCLSNERSGGADFCLGAKPAAKFPSAADYRQAGVTKV